MLASTRLELEESRGEWRGGKLPQLGICSQPKRKQLQVFRKSPVEYWNIGRLYTYMHFLK